MRKLWCIDNVAQAEAMNKVFFSLGRGKTSALSKTARDHLAKCAACSKDLELWRSQAENSYEMSLVNNLIDLAMRSDPSVERKAVSKGWALF